MKPPIKVTVTGSTGQIGYSLLFKIANGEMFGKDQPIDLMMLGVYPGAGAARVGLAMELEDCAYSQLNSLASTTDLDEGFGDANWIIMLGSSPRKKGMERIDLLRQNGRMFASQGRSIDKNAAQDAKILVVGNPCNTNALIAMSNAARIPRERWFALTRLDENRAKAQLAKKAGVKAGDVKNMCVWGNHSNTQFPDFTNATICGKPVSESIRDENWLENDFIKIGPQPRKRNHRRARSLKCRKRCKRGRRHSPFDNFSNPQRRLAQRRSLLRRKLRYRRGSDMFHAHNKRREKLEHRQIAKDK